jgi:O-antigen/teichoic acid export membrane protein
MATGWWLALPAFEALLVPDSYHGSFQRYLTVMIPAIGALGIIAAGLNPVFQIRRRTGAVTLAALAGLGACIVGMFILPGIMGPIGYAWAQTVGFVTVMLVMIALAGPALHWRGIGRELAIVVFATAAMALCVWPLRGTMAPLTEFAVIATIGALVFIGIVLLANVSGCRTALKLALARLRR